MAYHIDSLNKQLLICRYCVQQYWHILKTGENKNMTNLGLFAANFGAYVILFLVFAGCGLAAAFAGIALRKKKNAEEALANGEIAESEA